MNKDLINKFESIYSTESDAIFRFCLLRVSNREQALDITQETFLRLWQSMQKDNEIFSSRALLFTIAHRLIIDWYRKKKSYSLDKMISNEEQGGFDVQDDKTTESKIISGAEGRFLMEQINKLGSPYRQPLYLRFVEDLSPPQIGKIMGISTNAVSVRINRGISELKKITGYDNTNKKI
jgi:RNA polymerase sigma-70 factor (ECF subfamily)